MKLLRRRPRDWRDFQEALIGLQRSLPQVEDPRIHELRRHLYQARVVTDGLVATES